MFSSLWLFTCNLLMNKVQVYCGECTKYRSPSRSKSTLRAAKGSAFKQCKVCRKSVSASKAMRQIFL